MLENRTCLWEDFNLAKHTHTHTRGDLLLSRTTHLICMICPQKAVISLRAIIRLLDWVMIMIAVDYDEGRSSVLSSSPPYPVCVLLSAELEASRRKTGMEGDQTLVISVWREPNVGWRGVEKKWWKRPWCCSRFVIYLSVLCFVSRRSSKTMNLCSKCFAGKRMWWITDRISLIRAQGCNFLVKNFPASPPVRFS